MLLRPDTPQSIDPRRLLEHVADRLRPHVGALVGAGALLVFGAAIALGFPLIVQHLMDAAFVEQNARMLDRFALLLLVLFGVKGVLTVGEVYLLGAVGEKIVTRLRDDLFSRLLTFEAGFFTERGPGELTSRLTSDCTTLQGALSQNIAEILRNALYLFGGLALLAWLHTDLMLITVAVAPAVVITAFLFGRALMRRSEAVQDRLAHANAAAEEALLQVPTVQSFVRVAEEAARYRDRLHVALEEALGRVRVRALFSGLVTFIAFAGIAAVLWQGGRLILTDQITAGQLVSFMLYAVQVAAAVSGLAGLWGGFQEAFGAAARVFGYLDREPEVRSPAEPTPLPEAADAQPEIAFRDVSFRYDEDEPWALEDLTLSIAPGEALALVGPSGAGKTTLAALISRFWDPTDGQVTLRGVPLGALDLDELRRTVGTVPQDPLLFSGTVAENIGYGDPDADREAIVEAARGAHADGFIRALSSGYETEVGERGVKLSGGQRQRIAIARILLKSPDVLVLDEATSNLDSESERHVEAALARAMEGRTTIIIAHRLSTVQRADRVAVLEGGRLVEIGTHEELLAADGLYRTLYEGQMLTGRGAVLP